MAGYSRYVLYGIYVVALVIDCAVDSKGEKKNDVNATTQSTYPIILYIIRYTQFSSDGGNRYHIDNVPKWKSFLISPFFFVSPFPL